MKRHYSVLTIRIAGNGPANYNLHLSAALVLLLIIASAYNSGFSAAGLLLLFAGTVGSFAAHEYAHLSLLTVFSPASERENLIVRNCTLFPFGMLTEVDAAPCRKAMCISALAGPVTSFLIAACCFSVIDSVENIAPALVRIIDALYQINFVLAVVNLLPIFPFDFSILFQNEGRISSRFLLLSAAISFLFFAYAAANSLVFLSIIFCSGSLVAIQTYLQLRMNDMASGFSASDVMIEKKYLTSISHGLSIHAAGPLVLKSFQPFFPVLQANQLLGVVERDSLLKASHLEHDGLVGSFMERNLPAVHPETSLNDVLLLFERSSVPLVIVELDGDFLGLLVKDRLMEFLFFKSAELASETARLQDNE